ncbi:hypothetical protein BGZ57DRAFT_878710 [Hyaloscypha finlandica]|nr:hypothetical protein BGZ57DRAFT_878710 [Hyaloscypha finlandica]
MQFHSILSTLTLMATAIVAQVQVGDSCSPNGRYSCCIYNYHLTGMCVCSKGVWVKGRCTSKSAPIMTAWIRLRLRRMDIMYEFFSLLFLYILFLF